MIDKCFVIVLLLKRLRAGQTVRRRSNEQLPQPMGVTLSRLHAQSPKLESAFYVQVPTLFQIVCVMYQGCLACSTCMRSYTATYLCKGADNTRTAAWGRLLDQLLTNLRDNPQVKHRLQQLTSLVSQATQVASKLVQGSS